MDDGPISAGHGVMPRQVAEIIVTLAGKPNRRGSGYLVGLTSVLTAAHVIEGAVSVQVRFDADLPGEWKAETIPCWTDPRCDLAVLTVIPREGKHAVAAARFGRIGGDRAAVLAARAVGFPRFKLKTYDGVENPKWYRDSHQADGSVAVLSNRREGTLEFTVPLPDRDPDPDVSPWEGMSGAAVWVDDRIVGVIAKHHRSDGLGRLAAVRLDISLERLEPAKRAQLRTLLSLPEVLRDVVPPSAGERVSTAYQAQVRKIAPKQLLDRDVELGELAEFCAGDELYAWWQAESWAGKSALMSWFVLYPPAGVDVVSLFIIAGQSDSNTCTDALIEQLAALIGESSAGQLTAGARQGTMLRLLDDAASRAREAGRRLVLVIDGLDEDSGTATGSSIAALLPRRSPPEVNVLIASRPDLAIPDDVDDDHPLRTITPRQLDVSEHARNIERSAKKELERLLRGEELPRKVLGLITAAGAGLTLGDLEELTQQPRYEIKHLLAGLFGRSVGSRTDPPSAGYPDEQVYLFTHETLRLVAQEQFGHSLAGYHGQLHAWADTYRQRGWPTGTPHYLLRSYTRMLASSGDSTRLVACATDQVRHDRLRDLTGGDVLAVTEISTAQQLILTQPEPDLTSLALLAVEQDHLTDRNSNVPTNLPAVWAMLGQFARAEALANSIPRPTTRTDALARVARAVIAVGDHDRAEELIAQIPSWNKRVRELAWLAAVVAASGDLVRAARLADEAEALIGQLTDLDQRAWALARLAAAVATGGDLARAARLIDEAEALAGQLTDLDRQGWMLRLLRAAAASGDLVQAARLADEAEALIGQLTDPTKRAWELVYLMEAVADGGDCDRAARLADEAEALIGQLMIPHDRVGASIQLAEAVAASGDLDRSARLADEAEAFLGQLTDLDRRAWALAWLAPTVAAGGDHNRAARAVDKAEAPVGQITDPGRRAEALAWLAEAMFTGGDHDRASRLADRAEACTGQFTHPNRRAWALTYLVKAVTAGGDHDRAEKLIGLIIDPNRRVWELAHLLEAVTAAGDHDRASRLAREAKSLIKQITDRSQRALARLALAGAAADHDQAEALTRLAIDPGGRVEALARRAAAAATVGDHDRAMTLADEAEALTEQLTTRHSRPEALARLAGILVETGKKTSSVPERSRISSPLMDRARRLLATALVTGQWAQVVVSLARVDPLAVTALADELQARGAWHNSGHHRDDRPPTIHHEAGGSRRAPRWVRGLLRRGEN